MDGIRLSFPTLGDLSNRERNSVTGGLSIALEIAWQMSQHQSLFGKHLLVLSACHFDCRSF